MGTNKTLLGVLGGVAAGALIGILIAPEKGSKTRRKILDKGQGYADDLKVKFDDLYDTIINKYESFVEQGKDIVEDKWENGKSTIENKFQEGKNALENKFEEGKDYASKKVDQIKN